MRAYDHSSRLTNQSVTMYVIELVMFTHFNRLTKKNTKKSEFLIIALLILLAGLFRLTNLETLPGAFFTDEAALGYNGWSLMTTGRDEYGKLLPLTLRSFDDYKPAIYSHLTIPGIALFGLSQTTSRLPAALFGTLLPVVLYLFIKEKTKNKNLAFLSALVVVVTPWHIEISRTAIEAGVAVTMTIAGLHLLDKKNDKYFWSGVVLLFIALFTYHTTRLIIPFLLIAQFFIFTEKKTKQAKSIIAVLAILGIGLAVFSSSSRFSQISVFSAQGARLKREEAIREDGGPIHVHLWETRLNHNKAVSAVKAAASSYVTNTSLSYLFIGGAQPPRVTIPETGQFLLVFLPFFLLGLAFATHKNSDFDRWMIAWLVLAPIPASLTTAEIPHTYRTLFMLVPIAYFIATGLQDGINYICARSKLMGDITAAAVGIAIVFNFANAWHQYEVHQQLHQPWYRQYGYKELVSYLNTLENSEKITVTNRENEPYMMVLFYNQVEPSVYQAQPEKRLGHDNIEEGKETWNLFHYTFSEQPCPYDEQDTNPNNYYVGVGTCELPAGFVREKQVNFLDGNPEFFVDRPMDINEKGKSKN